MALIPQTFPAPPEAAVASFSFTDIAEGTGTQIFFGIASEGFASGFDYHLITTKDAHSAKIVTAGTAGVNTYNFDSAAFNLPRQARGTAYLSVGLGVTGGVSHIAGQIQKVHVDGTTTTDLSSQLSGQVINSGPSVTAMMFIPFPITRDIIKKGERLRLVIRHQSDGNISEFGHDPQNQDGIIIKPGTKGTTILRLLMPFRIDL